MAGVRKLQVVETEAALKEAARRVFTRRGYLNTKITDITAEAGRAAGSFYRHFSSKESLLESLLADMLEHADQDAAEPGHSHDFSDSTAVRWHVAAFWSFFRANMSVMVALHQASMVDERFARRVNELLAPDLRHIADHLEGVRVAGGELPGDPVVVASALNGLLSQFALTWVVGGGEDIGRELSDDEAVDTLTSLIMYGIAGQRPARDGET